MKRVFVRRRSYTDHAKQRERDVIYIGISKVRIQEVAAKAGLTAKAANDMVMMLAGPDLREEVRC